MHTCALPDKLNEFLAILIAKYQLSSSVLTSTNKYSQQSTVFRGKACIKISDIMDIEN